MLFICYEVCAVLSDAWVYFQLGIYNNTGKQLLAVKRLVALTYKMQLPLAHTKWSVYWLYCSQETGLCLIIHSPCNNNMYIINVPLPYDYIYVNIPMVKWVTAYHVLCITYSCFHHVHTQCIYLNVINKLPSNSLTDRSSSSLGIKCYYWLCLTTSKIARTTWMAMGGI